MYLNHPLLLVLLVPAWWAYWRWAWGTAVRNVIRLGLVAVLVVLAAGPAATTPGPGDTLLLVVDRSQSMPAAANRVRAQLARRAADECGPSHRLAVVGFGAEPVVERHPDPDQPPETAVRRIDPSQSNLYRAIASALKLASDERRCRMLVLSDGLAGDRMPESLVAQLRQRAVPVDVLIAERPTSGDVRVRQVHGPSTVSAGSDVTFEFDIAAPQPAAGTLRVLRDNQQIAAIPVAADASGTSTTCRVKADFVGIAHFRFELEVPRDPTPENNSWSCWVESLGPPVVLVVHATGAATALPAWLRAAGFHVETISATGSALPAARLAGAAAVLLDNVSAEDLGPLAVGQITRYVQRLDGGLVLTGGPRSYLAGGYQSSPLEPLLPVRLRGVSSASRPPIAVAVLLAQPRGELTGTAGDTGTRAVRNAIRGLARALAPQDAIALVDLDFESPVVLPLTAPDQISQLQDALSDIGPSNESASTERSLFAAFDLLNSAAQPNRHLLIVADVGQTSVFASIPDIVRRVRLPVGSTSILTWGQRPDLTLAGQLAALYPSLRMLATTDVDQLASLFLDDLAFRTGSGIARRELTVQSVGVAVAGPRIASFHAGELREGATATLMAADGPTKIVLGAKRSHRRGRVASLLFPMPATASESDPMAAAVIDHVRWATQRSAAAPKLVAAVEVSGRTAMVALEASPPAGAVPGEPVSLVIESLESSGEPQEVPFELADGGWRARFDIDGIEPIVPLVCRGGQVLWRGPPLVAARPAEFLDDRRPGDGRAELLELARQTGGREVDDDDRLFARAVDVTRSRASPFAWLGLLLLLLDIAERRIGLRVPERWARRPAAPVGDTIGPVTVGPDAYERAKERSRRRTARG